MGGNKTFGHLFAIDDSQFLPNMENGNKRELRNRKSKVLLSPIVPTLLMFHSRITFYLSLSLMLFCANEHHSCDLPS